MSSYRDILPKGDSTSAALHSLHRQKQKRHRHTDAEWASQKDRILQLWQNHDAKTVLSILKDQHKFETGQRTLLSKLRDWGAIRKYVKHENMVFVVLKQEQRLERLGKTTEFFFHGQLLTKERLERYSQRGNTTELVPSPLPETPAGITYRTPESCQPRTPVGAAVLSLQPSPSAGAEANFDLPSLREFELSLWPITTIVGYNRIIDPEPEHPTHRHRVGKVGVQFTKLPLDPSLQEYLVEQATKSGVEIRDILSQQVLPADLEAPAMRVQGAPTVHAWITSNQYNGFTDVRSEGSILFWVQYGEPFRRMASRFLSTPDYYAPNWASLGDEEGAQLQNHINRIADRNAARTRDSRYVDIYIHGASLENAGAFFAKISLCVGSFSSPVCHICETDLLTIQFFGASGAVAINVPLPTTPVASKNQSLSGVETKQHTGLWSDAIRGILGHQSLEPCHKDDIFIKDDVCLLRHELVHDPGVWAPLAEMDRQATFQTFPLARHACCNWQHEPCGQHELQGEEVFDRYPDHEETFKTL